MGLSFGGESSSRVGRELNAARLSRVTRVSRRSSYDRRPVVFCLVPCALIRGTDDGRPNTRDACGCASRQRPSPPALGPPRAPGVAVVARAPLRPPQSRGGAKTLRLTVRSGRYRAADGGLERRTRRCSMGDAAHTLADTRAYGTSSSFSTDRPTTRAPYRLEFDTARDSLLPATGEPPDPPSGEISVASRPPPRPGSDRLAPPTTNAGPRQTKTQSTWHTLEHTHTCAHFALTSVESTCAP